MKKSKHISLIILLCIGIVLIIEQETVQSGAKEGIALCIETLLPSLFPFMVLTTTLLNATENISLRSFIKRKGKYTQSSITAKIFLIGLLGGYPIGATLISTCYQNKTIDKSTARRLLGFCNNAGPAFIFGVISHSFSSLGIVLAAWIIHILSAYFTGLILLQQETDTVFNNPTIQHNRQSNIIKQCVQTMGIICGWVIIFRIVMAFMAKFIPTSFPAEWNVILAGILELTNGCIQLNLIENQAMRFLVCNCFIASGGLCVLMQTASVSNHIGLYYYFPGKIIQTALSTILSICAQWFLFEKHLSVSRSLMCTMILTIFVIFVGSIISSENYSRFCRRFAL